MVKDYDRYDRDDPRFISDEELRELDEWENRPCKTPDYQGEDLPGMLDHYKKEILENICQKAASGNAAAQNLYTKLTMPAKGMQSFVKFDLPDNLESLDAKDLRKISLSLFKSVSKGKMSLEQAHDLAKIIEAVILANQETEDKKRIDELENKLSENPLERIRSAYKEKTGAVLLPVERGVTDEPGDKQKD